MIVYYLLWCALLSGLSFHRRRFASQRAASCERAHTLTPRTYIQYTSAPERVRSARERAKRERESEVLNAKQTHSHGRYFPSGCQISRRPRLWLCVCDDGVKIITFIHIECMAGHQWGAEQRARRKRAEPLFIIRPRALAANTHTFRLTALEMRCACISLNFLWQVTSSLPSPPILLQISILFAETHVHYGLVNVSW